MLLTLLALISPAQAGNVKGVAFAEVTGFTAERACGVTMDRGRLAVLRGLSIADADEAPLEKELLRLKPIVDRALADEGAATWCAGALDLFGPAGSVAPGLLRAR